jgi:hypothetical protein
MTGDPDFDVNPLRMSDDAFMRSWKAEESRLKAIRIAEEKEAARRALPDWEEWSRQMAKVQL